MILELLVTLRKTIFLFSIIFFCNYILSCGLRTSPKNIPEITPKSTINKMKVIQKGNLIRISWEISEIERINALSKLYKDPFDNESERSKIFGEKNIYYQKLKLRLPKITIDLICKWFQENFDKMEQREKALTKWYNKQFDNEVEKKDAFSKLSDNHNLQEYFLIKEWKKPFECIDCEPVLEKTINVDFSSKSIVREGHNFYYYLEIPKKDLFFREYELSHHAPDNEILSPVKRLKLRKNNLFPKVPTPTFKIIQIEDAKKMIQFAFGKVIIKESTLTNVLNEKENLSLLENKKPDQNKVNGFMKFILKISWPLIHRLDIKKLSGTGDYFEEKKHFQVNLYRTRPGKNWSETPINSNTNTKNYFLDEIKLDLNTVKSNKFLDLKPKDLSSKIPFYIDLKDQNGDTWLYKIRVVDDFGNESIASEAITVNFPKNMINGRYTRNKSDVPNTN